MTILSPTQSVTSTAADALDPAAIAARKTAAPSPAASLAARSLFQASLEGASTAASAKPAKETDTSASISKIYRGSRSGLLSPTQQFESFVLRSFVDSMLPAENTTFFGTGTAGQIWKSMLAERIGDEMARDGGIGIADLIAKRGPAGTGAVADASETLATAQAVGTASALKGTKTP